MTSNTNRSCSRLNTGTMTTRSPNTARPMRTGKNVWDRWEYVTRTRQTAANNLGPNIIYNSWRLTEVQKDQVEEIHLQDRWNNEYAILLNGVLMTPVGMPLPWGYDDLNIVQQNLEPFHPFFAYGRSLVKRMKANTAIYDEMLKMGVLEDPEVLHARAHEPYRQDPLAPHVYARQDHGRHQARADPDD